MPARPPNLMSPEFHIEMLAGKVPAGFLRPMHRTTDREEEEEEWGGGRREGETDSQEGLSRLPSALELEEEEEQEHNQISQSQRRRHRRSLFPNSYSLLVLLVTGLLLASQAITQAGKKRAKITHFSRVKGESTWLI